MDFDGRSFGTTFCSEIKLVHYESHSVLHLFALSGEKIGASRCTFQDGQWW